MGVDTCPVTQPAAGFEAGLSWLILVTRAPIIIEDNTHYTVLITQYTVHFVVSHNVIYLLNLLKVKQSDVICAQPLVLLYCLC